MFTEAKQTQSQALMDSITIGVENHCDGSVATIVMVDLIVSQERAPAYWC